VAPGYALQCTDIAHAEKTILQRVTLLTNIQVLISFSIINATTLFLVCSWLCCRRERSPCPKEVQTALVNLNIAQNAIIIVLLAFCLSKKDALDWLHLRYAADAGALSAWQTIFTAIAIPKYLAKYVLVGPSIALVMVMTLLLGMVVKTKLTTSIKDLPQCYSPEILSTFSRWQLIFYVGLLVFLLLTLCLNGRESQPSGKFAWIWRMGSWPTWGIFVYIALPAVILAVEITFMFADEKGFRPLLDPAEQSWALGQVLTLAAAAFACFLAAFGAFKCNGKSVAQPF
jgi:hypothetical protein